MPLDEEDPWGDTAVREPATNTRVLTPTGAYSNGKASNQETAFDPPLPHFDSSESLDDNSEADNEDLSHINIDKADTVTVQIAPEKEGYIFKHVMYIVQNSERSSRVLRRYNDFAWLYDAITRRYPTRMIPTLPPKNLGGRTDAFLEKRRKGLSRFLNSLLRHPVLSKDELVHVFFTEPSELGEWKKQNTPSLEEDFARLQMDNASNEATSSWNERFEKAQSRNELAVKAYTEMCFTMDRIAKRQANQAKDYTRYGASLSSLSELENWCYTEACQRRCNQVRLDSEQVAKHLQKARVKMQNNAEALYADTLEQLKRQRDLCMSFKDLCLRKPKVWGNTLEGLEKRLKANIIKVNQNRGIPGMEAEVEKLDNAIEQDKHALNLEQKRRAYIAKCIEEEIRYLQEQESYAIILHRNFTQLQAESEQNLLNIWHQLENKLSGST
ncbi:hypothetical protein INT43_004189 [Umbelopsis isabellina]|uniref:Sorting nexin MVP1 n=1 Tax=Mortierella isabellina TaxID=91625 RepID=A0A8H7PIG4_MORIS|nr:hypothetical protein INT43_004189 [Umbelopsis isabellina]